MHSDETEPTRPMSQLLSRRLSPAHLEMLRRDSAIADEVIAARGYRTVVDAAELAALGFSPAQFHGTCEARQRLIRRGEPATHRQQLPAYAVELGLVALPAQAVGRQHGVDP
jgi:hypothetical protein